MLSAQCPQRLRRIWVTRIKEKKEKMGYQTSFEGKFAISPPLKTEHRQYLTAFAETRRMRRDVELALVKPDPLREAVGLPIGEEAGFFVGGTGFYGQDFDKSVVNYNTPPTGQPGLWCQWRASDDGAWLCADGGKFYNYVEWLKYLIERFLTPWGYEVSGIVKWRGEHQKDLGTISVSVVGIQVTRLI